MSDFNNPATPCNKCGKSGELVYQALPYKDFEHGFDYRCGWCGKWQLDKESDSKQRFTGQTEKFEQSFNEVFISGESND